MKNVILISGMLATGKSTLAKKLSSELNIPYFYKDKVKELICDKVGFKNREENKNISFATFEVLNFICNQMMEVNLDFIVESNFRQNELDTIYKLATMHNYNIVNIILSGDMEVLYQRYMNRINNEFRHEAHMNFTTKEEFIEYVDASKERMYYGQSIKIDTTDFKRLDNIIELVKTNINL